MVEQGVSELSEIPARVAIGKAKGKDLTREPSPHHTPIRDGAGYQVILRTKNYGAEVPIWQKG